MRAVAFQRYGGPEVLEAVEVERPRPGVGEVLVRVRATTVTAAEAGMRRGRPLWGRPIIGVLRPRARIRILGTEFAGTIEAMGDGVEGYALGDAVFGFSGFDVGANAEFICVPHRRSLCHKPDGLTFEQAAALVDGASTALFFLRDKADVQPGQKAAIIGASGSVGSYAVQLARHFGAEVTAVCSGANADMVRDLGAHHVVDYTQQDFAATEQRYDVVFDTVDKCPFARCARVLKPHGVYVPTTGLINLWWAAWTRLRRGPRVLTGMSVDKTEALPLLCDLVESGAVRIVIDRTYPLDQLAEAHRYVDTGRKRGNVVIRV